jgi:glycosyltransferase involved in cell wall biosynthesis
MGTPVVVTHNHYGFLDDVDSVVTSPEEIVNRVKSLYENETEFERVREGGHKRFLEHHTAEAVGSRFLEICVFASKSY